MIAGFTLPLILAAALGAPAASAESTAAHVVYDSEGFSDSTVFSEGPLRAVEHGEARWIPASGSATPAEIVTLAAGPAERALRRHQSAGQPTDTDFLDFPPVTGGALTVSFDARVSTADARTLDIFLSRTGESHPDAQASCLIWGVQPGYLGYYDGRYRRLAPIDTAWHRYEIEHHLAANTFTVRIDGEVAGSGLAWRNTFPPDTAFGRLRIGSIRGAAGDYADITNLQVTRGPAPPAITIPSPLARGGLVDPETGFRFDVTGVSTPGVTATLVLNGEDVSNRLSKTTATGTATYTLTDLAPDTAYTAEVTVSNAAGSTTRETTFYTYTDTVDGYRGIWFTLGQLSGEYGDKYSAGSAFAWSHTLTPMAVYAPEVDKTFFVYSGVTGPDERYLLAMASYYDHAKHRVPRPTIVRDQRGVDDPHDNASIALDESGHVWVFLAGRGRARPGQIFRATEPYSVAAFEQIAEREQTYSQIWPVPDAGFLHLLTKYTAGRELYWETSADGRHWSEQRKLAGFGGHYEVSRLHGGKVGTAFNYHPDGNVDRRTNIYYVETADFGETWTTVEGEPLETPLDAIQNPALVAEYASQGKNVYIQKLLMDTAGRPAILYLASSGHEPGPDNAPRTWRLTRWDGAAWRTSTITQSDHNYDAGSFYIGEDRWRVMAPALPGPQPWHTGGEVGLWVSSDQGESWALERRVTRDSPFNHSYVRRPHNPADPFFAMWADGDSSEFSPSRIYFTNADGSKLYTLPYTMEGDFAEPVLLDPPAPPRP